MKGNSLSLRGHEQLVQAPHHRLGDLIETLKRRFGRFLVLEARSRRSHQLREKLSYQSCCHPNIERANHAISASASCTNRMGATLPGRLTAGLQEALNPHRTPGAPLTQCHERAISPAHAAGGVSSIKQPHPATQSRDRAR
jgi:hypothetical protein